MNPNPPPPSENNTYQECEQRAIEFTGGTAESLSDALDQWENERQAMADLYDENQAYNIRNRKLWLCLQLADKAIAAVETDAGMFITTKARAVIQKFRDHFSNLNRTLDIELNERSANHVNPDPHS